MSTQSNSQFYFTDLLTYVTSLFIFPSPVLSFLLAFLSASIPHTLSYYVSFHEQIKPCLGVRKQFSACILLTSLSTSRLHADTFLSQRAKEPSQHVFRPLAVKSQPISRPARYASMEAPSSISSEFPFFTNGDVTLFIPPGNFYKLHSDILRRCSGFFADVLTEENAAN